MLPDGFGHWLAGFLDGEGCFVLKVNRKSASRVNYVCTAEITLRADDAAVLYEIAERTGLGRVSGKPTNGRGGRKPHVRWQVQRKAEVVALVLLLDEYPLRAKKARDYAIWRQAVLAWERGDVATLARLGPELRAVRVYAPDPNAWREAA